MPSSGSKGSTGQSLLPAIFVIVVIWFFVRGGKIHVEFPDRDDRNRLN